MNKVWLSGVVRTQPKIRSISERTRLTFFDVSIVETWTSPSGESKHHRNDIPVEVLGKDAERVYRELKAGMTVDIDGYLRTEIFRGRLAITVRTFFIQYEEGDNGIHPNDPSGDGRRSFENVKFNRKPSSSK